MELRPAGTSCLETGFTRVVNEYGCLLVSPKEIGVAAASSRHEPGYAPAAEAEVVWKGTQRPDGWDLGVKLTDAIMDFWGVGF